MVLKWLTELAKSIHWFNPFIYKVAKGLGGSCELSCDELAVERASGEERLRYGKALLLAASQAVESRQPCSVVSMCGNSRNLKKRLENIMIPKRRTAAGTALASVTAAALIGGSFLVCGFSWGSSFHAEAENLVTQLAKSVSIAEDQQSISFTIPDADMKGLEWGISVIAEKRPFSEWVFESEGQLASWKPGRTYFWASSEGEAAEAIRFRASLRDVKSGRFLWRAEVYQDKIIVAQCGDADNYRTAYLDFVQEPQPGYRQGLKCFEYDIDGNGIPELFAEDNATDGAFLDVYTYEAGQVYYAGRMRDWLFRLPDEAGIYNYNETAPGIFESVYYELEDHQLIMKKGAVELHSRRMNPETKSTYWMNGKEIEKEAYDAAVIQYFHVPTAIYEGHSVANVNHTVNQQLDYLKTLKDEELQRELFDFWKLYSCPSVKPEWLKGEEESIYDEPEYFTAYKALDEQKMARLKTLSRLEASARLAQIADYLVKDLRDEEILLYKTQVTEFISKYFSEDCAALMALADQRSDQLYFETYRESDPE